MPTPRQFDVVILGAGAAGLLCAAQAGQRGRRVALVDHNPQPGRKLLISGGGRSNFTNLNCSPDRFLSANPRFAASALAGYTPEHFLELVGRYGIGWHEKTLGQLFCDGSARQLLDMLLAECERGGVELFLDTKIQKVEGAPGAFRVESSRGELAAQALVVATGGLSIPKLGATGVGYELARQFGLRRVAPRPALVPLLLAGDEAGWSALAGVSAEVEVRTGKAAFREKLLVTHRGLSGPAILQASSYWRPGEPISVDFGPSLAKGEALLAPLRAKNAIRDIHTLRRTLNGHFSQRLAGHLAQSAASQGWTNAALDEAERRLRARPFHPSGTEGYEKAEVTAGGVDTRDLDARTLESRAVSGLFFIGEVVDVTGQLGGYNLQWAWSSAVAAARAL